MTAPCSRHDLATRLAGIGINQDPAHGAVMPPLNLSSNYSFDGLEGKRRYDYSRSGNPTRDLLGEALTALEGGAGTVVTSSGMAAVDLVLSELTPGDLILAPHDGYGGTHRLLTARAARGHFDVAFVDQTDPVALAVALRRGPKVVLVETPSNPLMRLTDIRAVCEAAHAVGAKVAVDNTFLSPALQQPIHLGADCVIHSTTKFINGHSDVVGGAVVSATQEDHERLAWWSNCLGTTGAPFDAWLTLRGLRTLFVRIERQQATAGDLADWLVQQPGVKAVHYPGLASHPGHELARQQQTGFGAMLSVELDGGRDAARAFVDGLQVFTLAESLGGVESLIAHPAGMTHAAMTPEARKVAGITEGLLRLSIGLEHVEDLRTELRAGLERAASTLPARKAA